MFFPPASCFSLNFFPALDAFAGNYLLTEKGKEPETRVIRRDGLQLFYDMPEYTSVELKPVSDDEFLARPIYRRFNFNRSADGNVVSVTLSDLSKVEPRAPQLAMKA